MVGIRPRVVLTLPLFTTHPSFVELTFLKNVSYTGVKLYNKMPNHLKNFANIHLLRKKLDFVFTTGLFCRRMCVTKMFIM